VARTNPIATYKDYTLKAVIVAPELLNSRLIAQGFKFIREENQHDFYFQVSKGKLKFRKGSHNNLITHYERILLQRTERTIVYRYDENPTEEEIDELFSKNKLIGEVQKKRKHYQLDNVFVHLDELFNGEKFIEIEAKDFENRYSEDQLKKQCHTVFERLGLRQYDAIKTGYFNS